MSEIERRVIAARLELREQPAGQPMISWRPAVFDVWSEDLGGFRELVQRGAFDRSLQSGADVRALFNHDPNYVLGRRSTGTLRVQVDDFGLRAEVDPPDTQWARDLVSQIRRGDVSQGSFAFLPAREGAVWSRLPDGEMRRQLSDVDLFDVSVVTFPAYPQTTAEVRSVVEALRAQGAKLPEPVDPEASVRAQAAYRERVLQLETVDW